MDRAQSEEKIPCGLCQKNNKLTTLLAIPVARYEGADDRHKEARDRFLSVHEAHERVRVEPVVRGEVAGAQKGGGTAATGGALGRLRRCGRW